MMPLSPCLREDLTQGAVSCTLSRMRKLLRLALILLPGLCVSCIQQQRHAGAQEEAAESKEPPPLHLGAVHQVYPDQHFALLRIIGPMPTAGTTLITHPPDGSNARIGNLVISAGQPARNNIIAADIRSGTVVQGDRVFQYRDVSLHPGKEQVAPELPTEEDERDLTVTETPPPTGWVEANAAGESQQTDRQTVETTVLPTEPSSPAAPSLPTAVPDYLNDIPDDITKWD